MPIPGMTPEEEADVLAKIGGMSGFQIPSALKYADGFNPSNFAGLPKFESLPQITEQAVATPPPPFVYTDSMGRRVLSREEKVENVYRQITGQVKNLDTAKYWRGGGIGAFGGIDGAARWIAGQLVDYGISSIDQIGQKEEPVLSPNYSADPYNANVLYNSFLNEWSQSGRPLPELGETVTFNNKRYVIDRVNFSGEPDVGLIPYEPTGQTEKIVINKNTGQPLVTPGHQHQYAANWVYPDGSAIFSGTYAGGGNTMFKMQFDSQGLPIFYSDGASSSDFELKDLAPFVAIASLAIPGMGVAIGNFVAGAAGLTVSAPVAAAIGAGVLNTVLTGDIKTGVLSAVGSYVGANIGKELGQAASGIFESSAGQNFIANIGAAGARAAVMGESVQDALSTAAVGGLFNLAASQIPGFDEIKDPKIKAAVADSINAALSTKGDMSEKLTNAALQGAITYGANKVEVDGKKFPELTPGQKSLIVTTLSSQLTGKPLNQELINAAISNTNNELTAAIKKPTPLASVGADEFTGGTPAAQPEDFGAGQMPAAQPGDVGAGQVTGGLPTVPTDVIQPTYSSFLGPTQVSPAGDVGPAIVRDNLSFPADPEAMGYQGFPRPVYEFPVTVPQGQFAPPTIESVPTETSPVITRQEPVASNEEILYPGSGVGTSIGELAGSGLVVIDVSAPTLGDRYERFRNALQPGTTQIWLSAELEGLQNIVDRMRAAGISDDVIEETLVAEQSRNADFRTSLSANRTSVGEGTSERPGGEVAAGIAIGESATPPEEGGRPFMGAGSGQTGGLPVFSLIAVDQGVSTYDMNNGFTLFAFSDGRQKVMDNETKVIVDLTPEEATELIPKVIEADRNAEAQVKSADKPASEVTPSDARPVDTQPVDSKPAEPIDVKPVDVKPSEVKPAEVSPDAQQVAADLARKVLADSEAKVTQEPAQLDASKLTATSPSTSTTSTSTGSTATGSTAAGSTATESTVTGSTATGPTVTGPANTGPVSTGATLTGGPSATDVTGGTSTGGTSTTATGSTATGSTATGPSADVTATGSTVTGPTTALQNANAIEASKIASGASAFDARYDLNKDGKVDQADIDALEGGAALNPVISTSQSTAGGDTVVAGDGSTDTGGTSTGGTSTSLTSTGPIATGPTADATGTTATGPTATGGTSTAQSGAGTSTDQVATDAGAGGVSTNTTSTGTTSTSTPATSTVSTDQGATGTIIGGPDTTATTTTTTTTPATTTTTPVDTTGGTVTLSDADITRIANSVVIPAGLSEADVKRIVTDVIATRPGLSATDVTTIVNEAVGKLPTAPTATDISTIVSTATKDFVTAKNLSDAISGITFPASLSKKDVEGIVSQVMRDNPGISTTDVQNIVNTAISNLPAYATPTDVSTAITTQLGTPSVKDDPNTPQDESRPASGIYQLFEQQEADRKKKEEEDKKKADEEARAAQVRLDMGRRQDLLQTGAGIAAAGLGAAALADSGIQQPVSPLQALQTGEGSKVEFESPLAAFFALQEPKEEPKQEAPLAMNYFTYGQPSEVSDILGLQEEDQMAASGGLMTPLMKGGGLSVVHYAGKPRIDFRKGSYVEGPGDGQSDDIPAMLADGEYVFDAETVAALGNGSNRAGAKLLDKMREEIRSHKRSGSLKKIPPPSKSPLEYLSMARRRS